MMLVTHALVGAALGRITRHKLGAFLVGIASHAAGDVIPHKEFPLETDGPLAAGALALLAWKFGPNSPEFLGALGGVLPDSEHLPTKLGLWSDGDELFPTHGPYPQPWLHSMGRTPNDNYAQIGIALSALLVLSADTEEVPTSTKPGT